MKQYFVEMLRYNIWANSKYREYFAEINFGDLSFKTPYGTFYDMILHLYKPHLMWLNRIDNSIKFREDQDHENWESLCKSWINHENIFLDFLNMREEKFFEKTIDYTFNNKKYTRKIKNIINHMIVHPIHHRGQISSLLRVHNFPAAPQTDMVFYYLDINVDKITLT
tara:strand:+ start:4557 stop:5057 length:501 start_codon:yes stop_codon:yes gene_type:complete